MSTKLKSREARLRRLSLQKGFFLRKRRSQSQDDSLYNYYLEAANGTGYIADGISSDNFNDVETFVRTFSVSL
jgi:hypothetical protein